MKKILLISLLLFSKIAFSQVFDSFSDGDFSKNPAWNGDINYFQVNAKMRLQAKGQQLASQTIALSTPSQFSLNASWEFLVQLNFDPTATNFVRIYLTSDQENLKGSLNGYFVQIGEAGTTDGLHLYKQTKTATTRLITGPQKTRAANNLFLAKIKVTRDEAGKWNLYSDVTGGNSFSLEGNVFDNTFTTSAYAGVFCKYATASRSNQYIFDDFKIDDLVPDRTPPTLIGVTSVDSVHLDVAFSEPLDATSASDLSNYSLSNGYGSPINVSTTAAATVYRLAYAKKFLSGAYTLVVNNVKDKKGNIIATDSKAVFKYIKPYTAQYGDVVINEIFANPSGSPGLPQKEFVEIWNSTDEYILTQGWKLADQTSSFTFGIDTISPNELVVLCAKADESLFKPFGKTVPLSPWPSLNNDKDILTLSDHTGRVIDKVAYFDSWYKDDVKKKGGFSLELIDPKNICRGIQNWSASTDAAGGTPGKQNSVYRSQISTAVPKLLSATIIDSVTIEVEFSKPVDSLSAAQPDHYVMNNGIGNPSSASVKLQGFEVVTLKFAAPFARGVEHTLTVGNVTDCAGNPVSPAANSAKLFIAKKIGVHDMLISEVLFNPKAGSVDFVEIYNNTDHVLDMKDLQLANADSAGAPANINVLSTKSMLIESKSYWVISTNTLSIQSNYFCENPDHFIQLKTLPVYNNDKGTVILLSGSLMIDRFDYTDKMKMPLLQNADGVSLERVSFLKGANDVGNFKSAAASVGFATPTYKNSQEPNGDVDFVEIAAKTFSPDGDGFEDVMNLDYQVAENANLATVNVFSDKGVLIRRLLKNQTIGTKGRLTWDGLNENGQKAGGDLCYPI
ncbi:lamin tail domain-containing protein [Pedobacter endophyticus]|uniref:Lamin tail domain-containing protein n=1 Tax=Pedobacter endophyticus TaxID=2789740 RepID=A0A7S9KYB9_9SPHI|nr:lamin tail domain-containing protein [Pedobacter endophyticus]QPH39076.1 lamin tail domain-containing protein [Pedobacter endophyticus]